MGIGLNKLQNLPFLSKPVNGDSQGASGIGKGFFTPKVKPSESTGAVDGIKVNSPEYSDGLAYKGVSSPMYGKPNINGARLDIKLEDDFYRLLK